MEAVFRGPSWMVTLPAGWRGRNDPECTTIYSHAADIGALQFSSARSKATVTDSDLKDFAAEHVEAGAKIGKVAFGKYTGFYLHFETDNVYWRYWYLRHGFTALLATYNCDPQKRGKEDVAVNQILASLRPAEDDR